MASKNLGAVIQRAISDGAFRRQLQSDPAAALRGFNLTPDEIAAVRSSDSSKLMSLGVDQRMSKAFSAGVAGASRSAVSDLNATTGSTVVAGDATAGNREGIIGTPASAARNAADVDTASGTRTANDIPGDGASRDSISDPTQAGTGRAFVDNSPTDTRGTLIDPVAAAGRGGSLAGDMSTGGTRAVHDSDPTDIRAAASTGGVAGTRAVHDSEPGVAGSSANDSVAAANAGRGGSLAGDMSTSATRAVHDSPPFGTTSSSAIEDPSSPEYAAAQDASVASRMADAGDASSIRQVHDVDPFEGNANAAAPSGEFLGDASIDPGHGSAGTFVPSDSADQQREMLEDHGNALGNTGGGEHNLS
jgi:hypothetical protein